MNIRGISLLSGTETVCRCRAACCKRGEVGENRSNPWRADVYRDRGLHMDWLEAQMELGYERCLSQQIRDEK